MFILEIEIEIDHTFIMEIEQGLVLKPYDIIYIYIYIYIYIHRGAGKSLARPGRKEATATEDFVFHISYL
jgi:hypothetical protein